MIGVGCDNGIDASDDSDKTVRNWHSSQCASHHCGGGHPLGLVSPVTTDQVAVVSGLSNRVGMIFQVIS